MLTYSARIYEIREHLADCIKDLRIKQVITTDQKESELLSHIIESLSEANCLLGRARTYEAEREEYLYHNKVSG